MGDTEPQESSGIPPKEELTPLGIKKQFWKDLLDGRIPMLLAGVSNLKDQASDDPALFMVQDIGHGLGIATRTYFRSIRDAKNPEKLSYEPSSTLQITGKESFRLIQDSRNVIEAISCDRKGVNVEISRQEGQFVIDTKGGAASLHQRKRNHTRSSEATDVVFDKDGNLTEVSSLIMIVESDSIIETQTGFPVNSVWITNNDIKRVKEGETFRKSHDMLGGTEATLSPTGGSLAIEIEGETATTRIQIPFNIDISAIRDQLFPAPSDKLFETPAVARADFPKDLAIGRPIDLDIPWRSASVRNICGIRIHQGKA